MSEETTTNQLPQQVISVLAVDDDHLFLHSCQRSLEHACFTVHTANNGNDALSMATDYDYDIVLLDINMPQMSGLSILSQLKKEHSKTEVIIVTGESDLETAVEAMKLGAADFLTKPLETTALIEKIETLVAQSRALLENNAENNSERRHNERRREKNERRQMEPDRRKNERRLNEDRRLQSNDPVIAHIQQHAAQISTRQDVANVMDMTLEQVSARVQSATGQSFRQWLNTCRLRRATQMLKDTELEISRIARDTGFATVQHFSRVFSNLTGISPRKYRQQNR